MLALEPEEVAERLIPELQQERLVSPAAIMDKLYQRGETAMWPSASWGKVHLALAEAWSWLAREGLVVPAPDQPIATGWYALTRRAQALKTAADAAAFREAGSIPTHLFHHRIAEKTRSLLLRGDYDTAVFQAFKEVEVAVRKAGGYPNDLVGTALMQKAFHPETGPLRDKWAVAAERQAEMFLFAGAMGHAKNPPSHRDVAMDRVQAVRLIAFASHLLHIVEIREMLS